MEVPVDNDKLNKSKELDALRAKLGLKEIKPKTGPEAAGARDEPAKPQDAFGLGVGGGVSTARPAPDRVISTPVKDVVIDESFAQPKSRKWAILGAVLITALGAAAFGLQFGKSMGIRSLQNAGNSQARAIRTMFFDSQADPSGRTLASKTEGVRQFTTSLTAYYTKNIATLRQIALVLGTGDPAEVEKLGEYASHQKLLELLKELGKILEKYSSEVEFLTPKGIFGETAYQPALVYEVTRFTSAANKLFADASVLADALMFLEGLNWSPAPPDKVPGDLLVWSIRKEHQEGAKGSLVQIIGTPKETKTVVEDVTCEPVKLPIQVPKCQVAEGEEPFEIHELDVFEKKVEQKVYTLHELKVKKVGEDKTANASGTDIVQVDARGFLQPLANQVRAQYQAEMINKALILNVVLDKLDALQDLGNSVNVDNFKEYLDTLADSPELFTM